jgi:hypothetical protein
MLLEFYRFLPKKGFWAFYTLRVRARDKTSRDKTLFFGDKTLNHRGQNLLLPSLAGDKRF